MKKIIIFLMLTQSSVFTFAQTLPSYIPANGLVSWYPFNGNANDESGNGNNGTTMGGAALTADRFSSPNSAYSFDGIDDYLISGSASGYLSDSISISFWINYNTDFGSYDVIDFGDNSGVRWGSIAGATMLRATVGRGCSNVGNILNYNTQAGWHMITYVIYGPNQDIYYDGNFVGVDTNSVLSSLSCATSNLYFGVDIFSAAEYYDGMLDDIGIWNRTLDSTEISQIYYGPTAGIKSEIGNEVIIFPNPVSDKVFVKPENNLRGTDYVITDLMGREVSIGEFRDQQTPIDISFLPRGIYFLRLGQRTQLIKIVKL